MNSRLKSQSVLRAGCSAFAICAIVGLVLPESSFAQVANNNKEEGVVVVTGQRAALRSAQKRKQLSDEVVDSIVADDIGKLPDRSVTEALQRVVGVTIDHNMTKGDPEHYSVEGSGVNIRGLSYVRSELNGRDSFSANGGRSLNFEDVPPELMAGVDIYKNPSAEQIEGAVGGLVNLRTLMPFDNKGFKGAVSLQGTYSTLKEGNADPSGSILLSNRWDTKYGEFGALVDVAYSESATRTDAFQVEPYYARTDLVAGKTLWVPKGAQWRTLMFDRKRFGAYGALQWRPDDKTETSLSVFNSHYKMQWDERAIFAQSNGYNIQVANGVYDSNGAFVSGILSDPADGGINMGADTRTATRESDTTEYAWKFQRRFSDRLTFTSDLQFIRSTTKGFDSTVATGVQMPNINVDLSGDYPLMTFTAADTAYLGDANNYYWAFTMEHLDKSVAKEFAWKGDVKYEIDKSIWKDIRVGVRLANRESANQNSNPSYNWAPITQTWQIGWNIPSLAYLGDPRFSNSTENYTFKNFFNGKATVPNLIFPAVSLATGYPDSYATLHGYNTTLCQSAGMFCYDTWTKASFTNDPSGGGVNNQEEKTYAAYAQAKFAFDDLITPIDGNIGLRVVRTDMAADGYVIYNANSSSIPDGSTGITVPTFTFSSSKTTVKNEYTNVLPSLNLRFKVSPEYQIRFAIAKAIARPDFTQLQNYTTISRNIDTSGSVITAYSLTGTGTGNPNLLPTQSTQVDLTSEWYFAPTGSLTIAAFYKNLSDVVVNKTYNFPLTATDGNVYNFSTTAPVNGADGKITGIEVAYQQYYDNLPSILSGLGLQANFTYVNSSMSGYNIGGVDLDGSTIGNLPLPYLSKYSYNVALMYDKGPISARLAYNWRSRYLQAVNVNGTQGTDGLDNNPSSATYGQHNVVWGLPTWAADYGQLDASFFYKFNEKLTFGLEAQNITDAMWKQEMQQNIGTKGRAWFVSGPRYTAQVRYTF
jgi:TonB-dependent receptor